MKTSMDFKELTKAEEEIMHVLWQLENAFVKEIIEQFPEPKPAYTTVSTIIRILEQKGFIEHRAFGKTHQYFPKISKESYRNFATNKLMAGYFKNSVGEMMSFLVNNQSIDLQEVDEILQLIETIKKEEKLK